MRIRSIKPEFWRSDDITSLAIEDRLLFVGMWSYVDDNGVGVDKLALIAADLFAGDLERDARETFARVSRGLQNLAEAGLIHRYVIDGKPFLEVDTWSEHQRIDKPNKPRYPHRDAENATPRESVATSSRESRETPAPGTEEQGNRGTEEQATTRKRAASLPADWKPTQEHLERATQDGIDVEREAVKFRAHAEEKGRVAKNWNGAFTRWLMQAAEYQAQRGGRPANVAAFRPKRDVGVDQWLA